MEFGTNSWWQKKFPNLDCAPGSFSKTFASTTGPVSCQQHTEGRTSMPLLGLASGSKGRAEKGQKLSRAGCARLRRQTPSRCSMGHDSKQIPCYCSPIPPTGSSNHIPHCLLVPQDTQKSLVHPFTKCLLSTDCRSTQCWGSAVTKKPSLPSPGHSSSGRDGHLTEDNTVHNSSGISAARALLECPARLPQATSSQDWAKGRPAGWVKGHGSWGAVGHGVG